MKRIVLIAMIALVTTLNGCRQSELEELYPDPGKTSKATVENFFAGVLQAPVIYVMPYYWRFFVVESPTMGHYTQVLGWVNSEKQYIPDASALNDRWTNFYTGPMAQYRELQKLYEESSEVDKADKRIFMLAATIFFYDQTQQIVDMWGDIPWSEAGKLKTNLGDLNKSLPKYDKGEDIYTAMLDDLKNIADELAEINVPTFYQNVFSSKDFLNDGNLLLWKKYCNSLRLRMLMRVSGVPAFQSRVQSEVAAILGNPSKYPVVDNNNENIMIDAKAPNLTTYDNPNSHWRIVDGFETWGMYNLAPKAIIDHMVANGDPRLPAMFDPNSDGDYVGLDPLENSADQNTKISNGLIARYDTATFSRNNFFPGWVITAAEVSFLKAEAYFKYSLGDAKAAYETGVKQSIELYYKINSTGTFRAPLASPDPADIDAYLQQPAVSWDANADKLNLIGTQKWLNTGISQMPQTWAELRRLNKPALQFMVDASSDQPNPPVRFVLPDTEKKLNSENYKAVQNTDNLNSKVFWDVD